MPILLQQMSRRNSEICSLAPNTVSPARERVAYTANRPAEQCNLTFMLRNTHFLLQHFCTKSQHIAEAARLDSDYLHEIMSFISLSPNYGAVQHFS
jgi:hypothetical protein